MSSAKLFALFLLSAFTLYPPSTTAQGVVDVNGEPIKNGGTYYLLPYIWAWGGGVGLAKTGNETCPLSVVQYPSEVNIGLPVKISSLVSTLWVPFGRVELSFTSVPVCATTPSSWTVVEGLPEGTVVKITGYETTESGYFVIDTASAPYIYKLSFCVTGRKGCGTIGIVRDDKQNRHLGVTTDNVFEFVLVKADEPTSSSA